MAIANKKAHRDEPKPIAALARMGTLEEVLKSNASLEVKAACIEMEIEARARQKQGSGSED